MNVDIKKISKKFKNKIGTKAKLLNSVEHDCYRIRITKSVTKDYVLNILNDLCTEYKLKKLNKNVPSPSVKKGSCTIGVSRIAKISPFKEIAVLVYFKKD
jgi:hypothetical protein